MMPNQIQSWDRLKLSKDGDIEDALYETVIPMATCTSVTSTGTGRSGTGTTIGLTIIGTRTTLLLVSQLSSFLSRYFAGEFCFES